MSHSTASSCPNRTCVVLQPGYLPWLGFFEQMDRADEFVLLDDVQFDKHGWRNRNRIKGPNGVQWLTVPVKVKGHGQPAIRDVGIDSTQAWTRKHLQSLRTCYGSSPFFDWLYPPLEALLSQPWTFLVDLDVALIDLLRETLGVRSNVSQSSELSIDSGRCERLLAMCQALDCKVYYSGAAARSYLDVELFARAGIRVEFQDYAHPTYPQRFGPFVPQLSVIDLMFNAGPESLGVIRQGARSTRAATPATQCVCEEPLSASAQTVAG